jgi:hypothetical protein
MVNSHNNDNQNPFHLALVTSFDRALGSHWQHWFTHQIGCAFCVIHHVLFSIAIGVLDFYCSGFLCGCACPCFNGTESKSKSYEISDRADPFQVNASL